MSDEQQPAIEHPAVPSPYMSQPAAAPPPGPSPAKKQPPLWAYIVSGVITLGIVICVVAAISAAPSGTTSPASGPTATTATVDLFTAYKEVVTHDSATVSNDFTALGNACQNGDSQGCRTALVTLRNDVRAFQADIDAHPAPACLKTADDDLRNGLALFDSGATLAIQGIDDNDASEITQGSESISAGNSEINKATDAFTAAQC